MNQEEMFFKLYVLTLLVSISFLFLFLFTKKSKKKNHLWKSFNVVTAFLLFIFFYAFVEDRMYLLVWLPLVVLATIYSNGSVKFCSSCGKASIRKNGHSSIKKCLSCGIHFK